MSQSGRDRNNNLLPIVNPIRTQAVINTSTVSAQSAAVGSTTTIVEVRSSVDGYYTTGDNPVATTVGGSDDSRRIYAMEPRTINIKPGQKVAIVLSAGTGTAEVTEMA